MKKRVKEFASIRLERDLKRQVELVALSEDRSLSQMLRILVKEALDKRQDEGAVAEG